MLENADRRVVGAGLEGMDLGVGSQKLDVGEPRIRGATPSVIEHP